MANNPIIASDPALKNLAAYLATVPNSTGMFAQILTTINDSQTLVSELNAYDAAALVPNPISFTAGGTGYQLVGNKPAINLDPANIILSDGQSASSMPTTAPTQVGVSGAIVGLLAHELGHFSDPTNPSELMEAGLLNLSDPADQHKTGIS